MRKLTGGKLKDGHMRSNAEEKRDDGWTAMMICAEYGHNKCAQLLIDVGNANVNVKTKNQSTALMPWWTVSCIQIAV